MSWRNTFFSFLVVLGFMMPIYADTAPVVTPTDVIYDGRFLITAGTAVISSSQTNVAVYASTDGVKWAEIANVPCLASGECHVARVAYGQALINGRGIGRIVVYVSTPDAVSKEFELYSDNEGASWKTYSSPNLPDFSQINKITFGYIQAKGMWLMSVGDSTQTQLLDSSDGITWQVLVVPAVNFLYANNYGLNKSATAIWQMIGEAADGSAANYLFDGNKWQKMGDLTCLFNGKNPSFAAQSNENFITWGLNGKQSSWVAVGFDQTSGKTNSAFTMDDGAHWSNCTTFNNDKGNIIPVGLAYDNLQKTWILLSESGTLYQSVNGADWKSDTLPVIKSGNNFIGSFTLINYLGKDNKSLLALLVAGENNGNPVLWVYKQDNPKTWQAISFILK